MTLTGTGPAGLFGPSVEQVYAKTLLPALRARLAAELEQRRREARRPRLAVDGFVFAVVPARGDRRHEVTLAFEPREVPGSGVGVGVG